MTPLSHSLYALNWVDLGPGNPEDPFRFLQETPRPRSSALFSIYVQDLEGNRLLDSHDRFFLEAPEGTLALSSDQGLTFLNYYLDPRVLARHRMGVRMGPESPMESTLVLRGEGSGSRLPLPLREALENYRLPYWEADGHLDLDILEGLRNYRPEENRPYSGWEGLGLYFNGRYAGRQLGITALVAGGFMVGEHMTSPAFMWQTYTTNFLSMATGSFDRHSRWISAIERAEAYSALPDLPAAQRRQANLQAADARAQLARDRLYWVFMSPIVVGACLADPNFRAFLRSPSILPRYFWGNSLISLSSIGKNPLGLGIAALVGFGIYEISSNWFDLYGGLRRGSTANQAFSSLSTLLVESVLLSRTSQELQALTGSGSLSAANLRELFRLRPGLGVSVRIPEGSLLARLWMRSPRTQALFQRSFLPSVELSSELGPTRFLNRFGLPRASLDARISTLERPLLQAAAVETRAAAVVSESILSRAALNAGSSVLAEGRGAAAAEAVFSVRRVRLAGLPILAAAGTAGLLIGAGYLTGYFNPRHTPRDLLRETLGI